MGKEGWAKINRINAKSCRYICGKCVENVICNFDTVFINYCNYRIDYSIQLLQEGNFSLLLLKAIRKLTLFIPIVLKLDFFFFNGRSDELICHRETNIFYF